MTWMVINVILLVILVLIFIYFGSNFAQNAFFDISILLTYVIFISPVTFFIINFLFFLITDINRIYISFLPLIIPLIYFLVEISRNKARKKTYFTAKKAINELLFSMEELNFTDKDIRIRIRSNKRIDFIINLDSENEEEKYLSVKPRIVKLLKDDLNRYNIRILFDVKKNFNFA